MSVALLEWSVLIAQLLLGLAMACTMWRMIVGPRAQDRVLALMPFMSQRVMLVTFGTHHITLYFEIARSSPCSAAGTVALGKFLLRGHRMSELPLWAAIPAAVLVLPAGCFPSGCIGLVSFQSFYARIRHRPWRALG